MLNDEKILKFLKVNSGILDNKVTKNFLDIDENQDLLRKSLVYNSKEASNRLDERFKEYFLRIRLIKYINKLIYFYTIDFDKRNRTRNERFSLILDAPVYDDQGTTIINMIFAEEETKDSLLYKYDTLSDVIENKEIYSAFNNLADKQKDVLDLIYIHNLLNKEVAHLFDESPQNISSIRRRALITLRKELEGGSSDG